VPQEDAGKGLEEEEDTKGIEMEADFEGELFDVPSDAEQSEGEGHEEEEEEERRLDQEMGEVGDQGQVVDERMWGDDDKPEEGQQPGQEKYVKNAPVQVKACLESLLCRFDCFEHCSACTSLPRAALSFP
jgi:midasin